MKRISLLWVIVVLLALVAGSVSAAPGPIKGGGSDWSHICLAEDNLDVFVASENVVQYDCKGTSTYDWSELCDKKAAMGYTSAKGGGIVVTCGI